MFLQRWQSCSSLRNSDRYLDNIDRYLDISDRYLDITGNVILFIDACVFTLPANIQSCSHIVLLVRVILGRFSTRRNFARGAEFPFVFSN
jgi:hypothetical protein